MSDSASIISADTAQRLDAMLGYLADSIRSGGEFASAQLPLVAQDVVRYGVVMSWASVCLSLLALALAVLMLRRGWKVVANLRDGDDGAALFASFTFAVGIALLVVFPLWFYHALGDAVMATFAPRMYVLEYIADLVK